MVKLSIIQRNPLFFTKHKQGLSSAYFTKKSTVFFLFFFLICTILVLIIHIFSLVVANVIVAKYLYGD